MSSDACGKDDESRGGYDAERAAEDLAEKARCGGGGGSAVLVVWGRSFRRRAKERDG